MSSIQVLKLQGEQDPVLLQVLLNSLWHASIGMKVNLQSKSAGIFQKGFRYS